jgi:DNA invertase Pin-like site-specific DNA recombinase
MDGGQLEPALAYFRMSTDKQDTSIQGQKERVYPHFKGKYHVLEEFIDEGKSGSKDVGRRVRFLQMIKDLTVGKYRHVKRVICLDTSRFGRLDTLDGAEYKKQLRKAGVCLDTAHDGFYDWRRSNDRIIDSVRSEGNHQQSLVIAEKGLQGRIRVTQQGKPNQTTPYGLAKLVTSPTGEKIVVSRTQRFATPKTWQSEFIPGDPAEVAAIEFMFDYYDSHDCSFGQLARILTDKGFPSPTGIGWQSDTVTWMLHNSVYKCKLRIGEVPKGAFFRTHKGQEKSVHDIAGESAPVYSEKDHQAIIKPELFERVQKKMARNRKRRHCAPKNTHGYALSGILHCGVCGKAMYGSVDKGSGKVIYRCRMPSSNASAKCGYWIAYEPNVLPYVIQNFLKQVTEDLPEPEPQSDEHHVLGNRLQSLDNALEQASERFLKAPKHLAPRLLAALEKMQAERDELAAKVKELHESARDPRKEWLERFRQEFFTLGQVTVSSPEKDHTSVDLTGLENVRLVLDVPPTVLREKLLRLDMRVYVWFQPKPKGRGYDLSKIRVKAELTGELVYEFALLCSEESSKAAS